MEKKELKKIYNVIFRLLRIFQNKKLTKKDDFSVCFSFY